MNLARRALFAASALAILGTAITGCEQGGSSGSGGAISGLIPAAGVIAVTSVVGKGGAESELILLDLRPAKTVIKTSNMFGLGLASRGALNPAFSPSGQRAAAASGSPGRTYDIFEFQLSDPAGTVRNLTAGLGGSAAESYEDPHYLAEDLIIAKHRQGGTFLGLVVIDSAGTLLARFSSSAGEELSRPILRTQMGQQVIVCWAGAGASARLNSFPIDLARVRAGLDQAGASVTLTDLLPGQPSGAYYPSPSLDSASVVLFTQPNAAGQDMIWRFDLNVGVSSLLMLPINNAVENNSDPVSMGNGRLLFSQTTAGSDYNVAAGFESSFSTTSRGLDELGFAVNGSSRNELGAAYSPSARL